MITTALDIILVVMLLFHSVLLIVTAYNYFMAPRMNKPKIFSDQQAKVSILIPARNEENNIENCLNSVFNSDYNNYEVKVLNDLSTDLTEQKVKAFQLKYRNLELLQGKELPDGWTGKNWACNQLAEKARGEFLLFLDADVIINPKAVQYAVAEIKDKKAHMLSIFPTQQIKSIGEWLIIPLMDWLLLTFLPLKKVYKSSNTAFAAANGQFMLFDKESYLLFGGHKKVKGKNVEDMEIARGFKQMRFKTITLLGNNYVTCRMYHNIKEASDGFTKNFYPGFNINGIKFILLLSFFSFLFILPFLLIYLESIFILIAGIIFIERMFTSLLSRQRLWINILLYPPQMIILIIIGIKSLIDNKRKNVYWKGRNIS